MRVLFVVNIVLPKMAESIDVPTASFGGWIGAMIKQLQMRPNMHIGVVARAPIPNFQSVNDGNVTYYAIPANKRNPLDVYSEDCMRVFSEFQPDILHVEGSESAAAKRFLELWSGRKVLSAQGIINGYSQYEFGSIPTSEFFATLRPSRWITGLLLGANKALNFMPRLKAEREAIASVQYVLGRTTWDRAHLWAHNNDAQYFACNRILRDTFYERVWSLEHAERFSIFVGNMSSPRKGGHFALRALALLINQYPNVSMKIAGNPPFSKGWRDWKTKFGYAAYLRALLDEFNLNSRVQFLGVLDSQAMADHMQSSHVCVLPSIIENSPNTLGESMIIGVPSVTAFSGGVLDMATPEVEALVYRDDDPAMLAYQVKRVFDSDDLARKLSKAGKIRARTTHDPINNADALLHCYDTILKSEVY
ncbi:glycosyltransferase family 4 protein [Mariniblastus sp.]|nr:glycosyltransferase family 4 protein [Mariniblastus sp.]